MKRKGIEAQGSLYLFGRFIGTTDAQQKKLLTEATLVGEAMAKANDFEKRMEDAHYIDGSKWEFATVCPPDQRREHYDALDGRAAWLYEAVTNDVAMHGQKTGKGQVYMAAYKDKDGEMAKNWIPTVAGKAWFPYFRFYSPKKAFLDRSWVLPDIEKAK